MNHLRLFILLPILCFSKAYCQQQVLQYKIIDQYVNDMVYDTVSKKIVMSIPSKDTAHGNTIGLFNPDSVRLSGTWFVGSEPRPIALIPGARYVYVGMDGSANVRKFDLATKTVVQTFSLGVHSFGGPRLAANISCQPGNDSVVAVALAVT